MTAVTPRRVFECLRRGQDLASWLEGVPDEFYQEIEKVSLDIFGQFDKIKEAATADFEKIKGYDTRKAFAFQAKGTQYPSLMFKLYDGEKLDDSIWHLLDKDF
jgi:hypothetical protein